MSNSVYDFGYRMPRFRTDFHLLLQTGDRLSTLLHGRCTDISEEGLAAEFRTSLEVGSIVTLILTLPGSSTTMKIAARVINCQREFHGFAFVFSSQTERSYIQAYIERLHCVTFPLSKPRE